MLMQASNVSVTLQLHISANQYNTSHSVPVAVYCNNSWVEFTSVYGEPLSFLQLTYSLTSPPPAAGQNSKLNPRLGNVRRSTVQGFRRNAKMFLVKIVVAHIWSKCDLICNHLSHPRTSLSESTWLSVKRLASMYLLPASLYLSGKWFSFASFALIKCYQFYLFQLKEWKRQAVQSKKHKPLNNIQWIS